MPKTVCRVIKHKHFGAIGGSEKHTARLRETLNADPTQENIRLIGSPDDPELPEMVQAVIATKTIGKVRKDAVLCSEILLSASADYFRPHDPSLAGEWDEQRMWDFAKAAKKWLLDSYGDKCIRAELHLDESTPHIHAYIVPINEKTKKLSHKDVFGGRRDSLSQLQDSFATAVEHLGIERGVKGSYATHTKIKEYYYAVNQEPLTLELDRLAPQPGETAKELHQRIKEDPTIAAINHQLADRWRILQQLQSLEQLAAEREKEKKELEAENSKWRQKAEQLQDLPLEEVAYHLGLERDTQDQGQWRGQGYIIDIPEVQRSGGSAIDLVMHIQECNFQKAVAWLHDRFGETGMLKAVRQDAFLQAKAIIREEPAPEFEPPAPDESQWPKIKHHLTQELSLPQTWIEALHRRGRVYADTEGNAVFQMRSLEGEITGAVLMENNYTRLAKGTKRGAGWFFINLGGTEEERVQQVVLTSSPIDALSKAALDEPHTNRTIYLVADSARASVAEPYRSLPLDFLKTVPTVVAAYNNDAAGKEMARQTGQLLPQTTIQMPHGFDWNEDWVQRQNQKRNEQKQLQRDNQLEL